VPAACAPSDPKENQPLVHEPDFRCSTVPFYQLLEWPFVALLATGVAKALSGKYENSAGEKKTVLIRLQKKFQLYATSPLTYQWSHGSGSLTASFHVLNSVPLRQLNSYRSTSLRFV